MIQIRTNFGHILSIGVSGVYLLHSLQADKNHLLIHSKKASALFLHNNWMLEI